MRFTLIIFFLLLRYVMSFAQTFSPLPPGFNHVVRCTEYDTINNILYAGGDFSHLGIPAQPQYQMNKIAQWNGVSWDSLGSGVYGNFINDLMMYNGNLLAAGRFNSIGGILTKGLGLWDGNVWQSFADAYDTSANLGNVIKMYQYNDSLYVGGGFDMINSLPANSIAMFDGSNWKTFPTISNLDVSVYAMKVYNNELYVGGNFYGGIGKGDIVKFDGTNWVSVGGGLSGAFTSVTDMEIYQGNLYICGSFSTSFGDPGNNVAMWDGSSWSQLGSGVTPGLFDMIIYNNELYVAGNIDIAGGMPVSKIAKWNGFNWNNLGVTGNFSNGIAALCTGNNHLFMGGAFLFFGTDSMNCIAQYDQLTDLHEYPKAELKLFPNPSQNIVNLSMYHSDYELSIINILGVTIAKLSFTGSNYSMELNKYVKDNGIYLIKAKSVNQVIQNQIIFQE